MRRSSLSGFQELNKTPYRWKNIYHLIIFLKTYRIHKSVKSFHIWKCEGLLKLKWTAGGSRGEIFNDILWTFRIKQKGMMLDSSYFMQKIMEFLKGDLMIVVGVRDGLIAKSDSDDAVEAGFLPEPTNNYHLIDVL